MDSKRKGGNEMIRIQIDVTENHGAAVATFAGIRRLVSQFFSKTFKVLDVKVTRIVEDKK
jgi:hypothetical protein